MAFNYGKVFLAYSQVPPIVSELEAIFEALPDETLLKALCIKRRTGRPRVPARILWRCHLVRYVLALPSVSTLIRTLQDNPFICQACGIESPDQIPSQPTFSRFLTVLSKSPYANMVREVSREMVRQCYERLPSFGERLAVDSTDIKAWANKGRKHNTDPDATWSVKSSVGNLKKFWLGYKGHLLVDIDYELPIALTVTTANVHDTKGATRVLRQARRTYGKFGPLVVTADAGYSSDALRRLIKHQYGAEPYIKAPRGHKKALAQETAEFKMAYNTRVAVEHCFSRLKEHRALNDVRVRRLPKVRLHCFLSLLILQAQALATGNLNSVRKVA